MGGDDTLCPTSTPKPPTPQNRRLRAGRTISLGGDTLVPRRDLAAELGMTDKALARLNLPTVYLARVAHVRRDESLKEIAGRARRRHEPQRRARTT